MPTYKFTVIQEMECEYVVDADDEELAEEFLMNDGEGDCISQNPGRITDVLRVESN